MKTSRQPTLALGFACFLVLAALFADFLSPNLPERQNLNQFYHPPSLIHFIDRDGEFHSRPFLYRTELTDPLDAKYSEKTDAEYPLEFFFKGYPYKLFGLIRTDIHLAGRSREPYYYPLGTDELGRGVAARVLAGTRTSLLIVSLGIVLYALLGLAIGTLAGLFGGWTDMILMRLSEFVLALPALYLILALRAFLPMRISFAQTLFLMVGTIAAVAWPPMARGIRGLILQLRISTYVEAARSMGATPMHIFLRHMFPSLLPFVLTQLVVAAPVFLLGELVLSFLNVGFQDSAESWGVMLRSLKDIRVITDFWWNLVPLAMIFLTLLSLNILSSRWCGKEDRVMRL